MKLSYHSQPNLGQHAAKSAFWIIGLGAIGELVRLGGTAVVARLLHPQDYGIFGMALAFAAFFQAFSQLGAVSALVQKKELTDEHLHSFFGCS